MWAGLEVSYSAADGLGPGFCSSDLQDVPGDGTKKKDWSDGWMPALEGSAQVAAPDVIRVSNNGNLSELVLGTSHILKTRPN